MRRTVVIASGLFLALPGTAFAQESWTGGYLGAYAEANYATTEFEDLSCWTACTKPTLQGTAPVVGATAGFDVQASDALVIGLAGDIGTGKERSLSSASYGLPTNGTITWRSKIDFQASLRARIGVTAGNSLIYVTGGMAFAKARFEAEGRDVPQWRPARSPNYDANWSGTLNGPLYGVGIETRLGKIGLRAELMQTRFAPQTSCFANSDGPAAGQCWSEPAVIPAIMRTSYSTTSARIGFSYRF